MAGINFVRRWVMGQMTKKADDGIMITLPDSSKVDLNVNITMDRLLRNGINPDAFTNPQQVDNAINMINSRMVERAIPANSAEGREITEKLFGKQKAPVFDLEGNRIPEGSGIMGGKAVKELMDSGQVTKGARGMKKSKKVEDREMFQAANERLTSDVDSIIKNIKSMEPITAMKEANSVIGRKGKYKNLTPEQSKKILKDTEDHIFERDIPEEDFAKGGRAGFAGGSDMGTVADSKGKTGPSKGGYQGGGTGPVEKPSGGGGGGGNNNNNPPFISTNNTTPDTTFFDKTSKSGLISNISPSILARLARIKKGITPILGEDVGLQYQNIDELNDIFTNFTITQDLKNLIKTKKLEPELKYRKEIGDNTFIEGGINQAGDASIMLKKQFADGGRIGFDDGDFVGKKKRTVAPQDFNEKLGIFADGTKISGKPMLKTPTINPEGITSTIPIEKSSSPIEKISAAPRFMGSIFDFKNIEDEEETLDGMASGGIARANFVGGGMGRRGFLKMLAGLGGGIAAAKTGILKFAGKEPAKQVAKEVVKQSAGTPPPYFFKLAEKIKMLGDDATAATDRTIAKTLKSKDGKSTYLLEEDVTSGDTIIKKINKEGDEMITDVEIMELKKGEVVKGKDGRPVRTPDEYEEVTEANARIEGDVFNDPYYSDGIQVDEIMKEVGEQAPSIKKADGGRIPYFKGGLAALKTLLNYFAKEKGTTGSKLLSDINPRKIDSGIKNLMSKEELNQLKENRTEYVKHLLNIIKSDKKFLDNNRELVEEAIAQAPIGMKEFAKEMSESIKRNSMKENRLERLSVYDKVNPNDAIMDVEMMIKNMSTGKDKRALNATGGVARLLGE